MFISSMSKHLDLVETRINEIEQAIACLPEGSLNIVHASDKGKPRVRYYHYHNGIQTSLSKSSPVTRDLARKKCLRLELKNLMSVRTAADMFMRHQQTTYNVLDFLADNPEICEILKDTSAPDDLSLSEWILNEQSPDQKLVPHPESRIHLMRSGHIVRSKSEGLIDNGLYDAKIPFRYEDPLTICGRTIFPDFTIRHPETGEFFYWEHFGLMDDGSYIDVAVKKIGLYAHAGILPGRNLIITSETRQAPLLNDDILSIIDHYFR